jgi:hypothetical protein
MSQATVPGDPLLQAIAALRVDVDRWLEEELGQLRGIEAATATQEVQVGSPPSARPAEPGRAQLPPAPGAGPTSIPIPIPIGSGQKADGGPAGSEDPRRRLSALAKHLDRRLRRAKGEAERP